MSNELCCEMLHNRLALIVPDAVFRKDFSATFHDERYERRETQYRMLA